jgi:hypothetical protein
MSEKLETMRVFAEMAWDRFDNAMKELTEKEIDWRPVPEANNIRWILTHISWEWNVRVQQVLKSDPSYLPKNWPNDYTGNTTYSLKNIMDDLNKGRTEGMNDLGKLKSADLDVDIPLWGGTKRRSFGLSNYISETIHHAGQIAYIRGAIKRWRQEETSFLM